MEEKSKTFVISPATGRNLMTPMVEYVTAQLATEYGTENATKVLQYALAEMARMDEDEEPTELALDMQNFGHPLIAFYRGLMTIGVDETEAVIKVRDIMLNSPKELRTRPWAEKK